MQATIGKCAGYAVASITLVALLLILLLAAAGLAEERQRSVLAGGAGGRSGAVGGPPTPAPAAVSQPQRPPVLTIYLVGSQEQAVFDAEQAEDANLIRLQLGAPPLTDEIIVINAQGMADGIITTAAASSPSVLVVDLR